jgi:two-component system alkaline phosphatase synthesis response regulator PhoP
VPATPVDRNASAHDSEAPSPWTPRPGVGRILVAEDERDLAELIRHHLSRESYDVVIVDNGVAALQYAKAHRPDAVLLDIMIPQMNGWEVCRSLKREPDTRQVPVIMVTGRVEEGDKVLGLELGADDYVTKPFSPRELVARVRAVIRRVKPLDESPRRLVVGDLEIDRERFEVVMRGRVVELTPKEFELLAVLVETPGRVFRREELLDRVWGRNEFVEPRTVDVHLARLRRKFLAAKTAAPAIEAVRGVGYRYREVGART